MRAKKTCASGNKIASRLQGVSVRYLDLSLGGDVCSLDTKKKLRTSRDAEQKRGLLELLINLQINSATLLTLLPHSLR